tara:strand:+ start:184 stop:846 length:663 start_codon:yes stop_codon:yes gene_type:complete
MTQQQRPPEPYGDDWKTWGRRLMQFMSQTRSPLVQQTGGESAADDGTLMWDRENLWPVISRSGVWRQIVIANGVAHLEITTDQTAASANTAYPLIYTIMPGSVGVSLGTPASRIVFTEGGAYTLSFTAQTHSSSGSTVNFWFWPRLNGVDIVDSAMQNTLHQNGATMIVSRTQIFNVNAGDYLEAYWATDSTNGSLQHHAANAFAPATPASTLAISRINA